MTGHKVTDAKVLHIALENLMRRWEWKSSDEKGAELQALRDLDVIFAETNSEASESASSPSQHPPQYPT